MSIWRNIMLFHYGNCKQEIEVLSKACEELRKSLCEAQSRKESAQNNLILQLGFNDKLQKDLDYANDALNKSVKVNHEQEAIYHYKLLELENEIRALRKEAVKPEEIINHPKKRDRKKGKS